MLRDAASVVRLHGDASGREPNTTFFLRLWCFASLPNSCLRWRRRRPRLRADARSPPQAARRRTARPINFTVGSTRSRSARVCLSLAPPAAGRSDPIGPPPRRILTLASRRRRTSPPIRSPRTGPDRTGPAGAFRRRSVRFWGEHDECRLGSPSGGGARRGTFGARPPPPADVDRCGPDNANLHPDGVSAPLPRGCRVQLTRLFSRQRAAAPWTRGAVAHRKADGGFFAK